MPRKQQAKKRKVMRPSERKAHAEERLQDPHYIPPSTRRFVKERDGNKCTRCGVTDELVIHHVIPVSEGGGREPENLITLCVSCHKVTHIERGDEYAIGMATSRHGQYWREPKGWAYRMTQAFMDEGAEERLGITVEQRIILASLIEERADPPNIWGLVQFLKRDELDIAYDLRRLKDKNLIAHTTLPDKPHLYRVNKDGVKGEFFYTRTYYDSNMNVIAEFGLTPFGEKPTEGTIRNAKTINA